VFEFWSNYENFPLFMSNVRSVEKTTDNRSHWVISGPAGSPIEWDAIVTRHIPDQLIEWKTAPESHIQHSGRVRFQQNADGSTRVDLRMFYNPVAGALAHAVAGIFGSDAKTKIDDDLLRMKTMIETGKRPHDAARQQAGQTSGAEPQS
jgi:uncharacterized membrane protein